VREETGLHLTTVNCEVAGGWGKPTGPDSSEPVTKDGRNIIKMGDREKSKYQNSKSTNIVMENGC
jgi:hypothetical protein